MTQSQKDELQREFNLLVSANLKKDGTPKKKADPAALLRIAKIHELARVQNEYESMLKCELEKIRMVEFIMDSGFHVGQSVKFKNPLANGFEEGKITGYALLPCPPQVGQIGVSIDGSAPYMFRPEELEIT